MLDIENKQILITNNPIDLVKNIEIDDYHPLK